VSVLSGISWTSAERSAEAEGGHLATITSAAENDFVFSLVDDAKWFKDYSGPWLGGSAPINRTNPADGWSWVTGEQWSFANWGGDLNNSGGKENRLQYNGIVTRWWNDKHDNAENDPTHLPIAYIIEIDGYHPKTP
jgi:hypothetical protein